MVFIVHESASVTSKHKKGLLCPLEVIVQEGKEAPFALQSSLFCITKRPLLRCKRGRFATKCSSFGILPIAHSRHKTSYYSVYQQYLYCTRKTQEFRTKDFVARSTGSFERSEMQILYLKLRFLRLLTLLTQPSFSVD